jgi:membrane-anchored protein YejM (alkaline phosphatase superfamily)
MGKCSNAFFSETTNIIKAKLYMNVHWMGLYKLYAFCSDMKFKMAATAIWSNVKLSPAVAAILNFISEQKT